MIWTAWTTLAALTMYLWVGTNVARGRTKHKVKAPSMEGPDAFQNVLRVQINTAEQMLMFLPALWMCAFFLSDRWAALGGALWIVGRIIYALAYYKDPSRRTFGFTLSLMANLGLMAATAAGLLMY